MPVISALTYTVTESTIVATWTTDTPADSNLSAGGKAAIDNGVAASSTSHQCVVTGLLNHTVYSCIVTSGGTSSSPQNVTTNSAQVRLPIISAANGLISSVNDANRGDTFKTFVSNDNKTYITEDDGRGFVVGQRTDANTQLSQLTDETNFIGTYISLSAYGAVASFNGTDGSGGTAMTNKSTGLFGLNGNLHMFVYRQETSVPTFRYCNWIKSSDHGATWNNFTAPSTFLANGNPVTPNDPSEPIQFYVNTLGKVSPVLYGKDDGTLGYNTVGNQIDGANAYVYCNFFKDAVGLFLLRIPRIQFDAQTTTAFEYWIGPGAPTPADFVNDSNWSASPTSATNIKSNVINAWAQIVFMPRINSYLMLWSRNDSPPNTTFLFYAAPTPAGPWTQIFSQSNTTSNQNWYGPFAMHRDVCENTLTQNIPIRIVYAGNPAGTFYKPNWSTLTLTVGAINMSRLTLFTDNFTRTNENPLSDSGAWVPFQEVGSNIAQLQVVSNSCESTTVSVRNANVVTGISFPSNQWAELTASSITGGPTLACRLRATSGNPGTAYDGNFSVSNFIIQRESGTTFTTLVTQAGTFTTGDVLRFEAIGTQLTLYKNNVSVATVSDATLSSGTAGIKINPGTPITTAVFSLFTAGSFVYAISGSAGVAGATVAYSGTASGSVVADGSGNYSITGLANGSYTLTPSLTGYTFSPVSSAQTVSNADITGVNFVATPLAPAGPPTGITITMLDGTTVVLSGKSYWTATQFVQSLRKQGGVWSIPPDPAAPATWYPYKNWKKVVTS